MECQIVKIIRKIKNYFNPKTEMVEVKKIMVEIPSSITLVTPPEPKKLKILKYTELELKILARYMKQAKNDFSRIDLAKVSAEIGRTETAILSKMKSILKKKV